MLRHGHTIDITNERGLTTRLTLNGRDQVESVRDADNRLWTYTYHDTGQLHQIIGPDGPSGPETETRTWTYDSKQRLASETHPESGTLQYEEYDAAGLLKRTRDASNPDSTPK